MLWGTGQVIAKRGLADTSLALFGFIRSGAAFLFVVVFGLFTTGFPVVASGLLVVAFFGGVLDSFVGAMLYMVALKGSPAHETIPLANTAPLWGVAAAVVFLSEPPRLAAFFAAALVVAGAYFLVSRRDRSQASAPRFGPVIALAAGVTWGIAETVPVKYCLTHGMIPVTYQLLAIGGSTAAWGVYLLLKGHLGRVRRSRMGMRIAVLTGCMNLFLGWLLWLAALDRAPASLVAPVRGLVVLFGFLASVIILKERPSRRCAIGVLLILGGVMLVSIAG